MIDCNGDLGCAFNMRSMAGARHWQRCSTLDTQLAPSETRTNVVCGCGHVSAVGATVYTGLGVQRVPVLVLVARVYPPLVMAAAAGASLVGVAALRVPRHCYHGVA